MNHFSCTQKSQYGSHFVHTMRQRSLLCDIIGAWISNQEQRHVSKSALKAANGSRTTLIDCNYKTRLKTQKRPKKIKMKKRNGGLALPRNPSQLSNTNQYSSGILVYVCCIQFPWHQFNQKKTKELEQQQVIPIWQLSKFVSPMPKKGTYASMSPLSTRINEIISPRKELTLE